MGTQTKHRGRPRRLATTLVVAAGTLALAGAATAASLGGITGAGLFATSMTVDIPVSPPFIAFDDFEACHNFLDGNQDTLGNGWVSHEGNWQCLGGGVARNSKRHSIGSATVDIGVADGIEISTFISRVSHQKGRSGPGLSLFHDGESFISVVYKRDLGVLVIGATLPSGFRELVVVDPISDYDQLTLSVRIHLPELTVLVDGSEVVTIDLSDPQILSADEQLLLLSNTRFGFAADNDNFSLFDDFRVLPWP